MRKALAAEGMEVYSTDSTLCPKSIAIDMAAVSIQTTKHVSV